MSKSQSWIFSWWYYFPYIVYAQKVKKEKKNRFQKVITKNGTICESCIYLKAVKVTESTLTNKNSMIHIKHIVIVHFNAAIQFIKLNQYFIEMPKKFPNNWHTVEK